MLQFDGSITRSLQRVPLSFEELLCLARLGFSVLRRYSRVLQLRLQLLDTTFILRLLLSCADIGIRTLQAALIF